MSTSTAPPETPAATVPRLDPVGAVAAVLIVASVLWRASVTGRGYLTADDFAIIAQAEEHGLGGLFTLYNNHFMPAGRLVTHVVNQFTDYEYWPYAALMVLGQLAVSIAFYRLLRLMLPAGWALLVPLCLFLFNPMTLEISAWWAVGVNMLPMQLAMIVALGAQVKYVFSGDRRNLVTLAAAVLVGLLFFEKALLIVPMVFLATLFLYAPGGPVHALVTTIRRWWQSWALLTAISLLFLGAYLATATGTSARVPRSAAEVGDFLTQFYGSSLASGLVGGPWSWLDAKDGPAVAAPSDLAQWISWAVIALVITVTVALRRSTAVRAWSLMVVFAGLAAGLIAATRLGSEMSGVAGLVPRYLGDVLLVAALCVGVAVSGLRRPAASAVGAEPVADPLPAPVRRFPQQFVVALGVCLVLLVANSVWSSRDWAADWSSKAARDYIRTTQAELSAAEPGTVFMDQPVPDLVMSAVIYPWNMQSNFFKPLDHGPVFVTEAEKLSVIDDSGHIRPAWVKGIRSQPGPLSGCGYQVKGGRTVTVPLNGELVDYWHTVRIGYLSDRDTEAFIKIGHRPAISFDVHRGLNAMFLLRMVDGDEVELSVADPEASFCTDEIEIGELVPQPVG
ncbi:hypothetical protein [Actinoplanes derwentensis]|uniref:4-amino-4-deoxy-L-arabinose transferase n=1 Tax=Actinoplanes derwentensis TaxID=113562 RepID=A0A1H2BLF5_9ACTN|nr:hypothetical protein [Actinoplanes derwentensis]GID88848.1 hypothetical protein Ade03nite_77720 [Actinoplanes derwentensis]SDT58729.1 hypothetical protein SAMN04489716_4690 [Actinoplanes derwentensis]